MLINKNTFIGLNASYIYAALSLTLIVFAIYSGTIGHDFVYDDNDLILKDQRVQGDGRLQQIFFEPFFSDEKGMHTAYYRPLLTLSYALNSRLTQNNSPVSYHLINVLLHVIVCFEILALTNLIFGNLELAFFASILFAVHPAHVPSVAWISGRSDILCAVFLLFSLICYTKYRSSPSERRFKIISLISFGFALLTKELAAMYLFAILAIDLHLQEWSVRKYRLNLDIKYYLQAFLILLMFVALHRYITSFAGEKTGLITILQNTPQAIGNFVQYVKIIFFPENLEFFYSSGKEVAYHILAAGTAIIFLVIAAVIFSKNWWLLLGMSWLVIFLIPVIGLVPISSWYSTADHMAYLPALGGIYVLIGVSSGVATKIFPSEHRKTIIVALSVGLVGYLSFLSYKNSAYWENDISLYRHLVTSAPSERTYGLLGGALLVSGRFSDAEKLYLEGTQEFPTSGDLWFGLSKVYIEKGDYQRVMQYLLVAEKYDNSNSEIYNNKGNIHLLRKDYAKALESYEKANQIDPLNWEAMYNLGLVYSITGHDYKAREFLEKFILLAPQSFSAQKAHAKTLIAASSARLPPPRE